MWALPCVGHGDGLVVGVGGHVGRDGGGAQAEGVAALQDALLGGEQLRNLLAVRGVLQGRKNLVTRRKTFHCNKILRKIIN